MIQIRPREGSKVALFAGFIFEPRERARGREGVKGKTGQGRDRARATAARSSLLTWPGRLEGRQSGGKGNGEERSAVRGGSLAH